MSIKIDSINTHYYCHKTMSTDTTKHQRENYKTVTFDTTLPSYTHETYHSRDQQKQEYKQSLLRVVEDQDTMLNDIEEGVNRLKTTATVIGDTVDDHNKLLSVTNNNFDNLNTKIVSTNRDLASLLRRIKENKCFCTMLLMIIVLIIVLCVLFSVGT